MRLDQYLVEKAYVQTRSKATDLIKRQCVLVDGRLARKPGMDIINESITIINDQAYVGRGAWKLLGAIETFSLDFKDKIVIDVGASTGGFTDVALRHGASLVYAYDVGSQQLDPTLRSDPRVRVFEQTNFLDVNIPLADIIVIDVSFISITAILNHIQGFKGLIVGLIKPQFEAGPIHMKKGVLKDVKKHQSIIKSVVHHANHLGLYVYGIMASTIKGKKGNQEYIIVMDGTLKDAVNLDKTIEDITC